MRWASGVNDTTEVSSVVSAVRSRAVVAMQASLRCSGLGGGASSAGRRAEQRARLRHGSLRQGRGPDAGLCTPGVVRCLALRVRLSETTWQSDGVGAEGPKVRMTAIPPSAARNEPALPTQREAG